MMPCWFRIFRVLNDRIDVDITAYNRKHRRKLLNFGEYPARTGPYHFLDWNLVSCVGLIRSTILEMSSERSRGWTESGTE